MNQQEHCRLALTTFGQQFAHIHKWLDEFAGTKDYKDYASHRRERHHQLGVDWIRSIWGPKAADAARQHIVEDLKQFGFDQRTDRFPRDTADYDRLLLELKQRNLTGDKTIITSTNEQPQKDQDR